MTDLDAGILNKRILIQEYIDSEDSEDGVSLDRNWSDVGNYWAEIKSFGSKQIYEYRSLNVQATHKIKVRANVPITEDCRIVYKGRYFTDLTIENENEDNVVKWVTCREMRN